MTTKTKTYSVLYAEDVPHYGTLEIEAATDAQAIAAAKTIGTDPLRNTTTDPDFFNTVCKRIVHIEDEDGETIAENIPLDDFHLCKADESRRRKIDAAQEMFDALEAQDMAECDPEAARRKGYFDHARALRKAALSKARGRQ